MNHASSEQRAFFQEHGWLVLNGIISTERMAGITEAFDRILQPFDGRENATSIGHGNAIWQVPGMCRRNEELLTHINAGLGEFVSDLLGARSIQLLQDTLIVKPARIGAPIDPSPGRSRSHFGG